MNWVAIGVIAETASAAAVIVSLLYLAIQIRQTTRQTASENLQSTVDRWVGAQTSVMRTEEGTEFLRRALRNYEALSPSQIGRLHTFMLDLVVPFQAIHAKHEAGLIDRRLWKTLREDMGAWFKCPGMLTLWNEVKFAYPPYLVDEIDAAIEDHEGAPFTETTPYFRAAPQDAMSGGT